MRIILSAFQLSILFSTWGSAHPSDLSPFILAIDQEETFPSNNDTSQISTDSDGSLELFKRQNCAANYYFCSTIVTTAVCCSTDSFCSVDNAGNAACCPAGRYCTGSIPIESNIPASTTTAGAPNPPFTTTDPGTGIILTFTATSTVPITVAATAFTTGLTPTYVSNIYNFPFPYIGASFPNSAACDSAYSSCADEYAVCTSDLGGGTPYGVTIQAPGGGTTVVGQAITVGATSLGAASAASVCSSLSGVACPGIAGGCAVFGTAAATGTGSVPGSAGRTVDEVRWSFLTVFGLIAGFLGCVS